MTVAVDKLQTLMQDELTITDMGVYQYVAGYVCRVALGVICTIL